MIDNNLILKINAYKKMHLNNGNIHFEERAVAVLITITSLFLSLTLSFELFNIESFLLLWIQCIIVSATFFIAITYRKIIDINNNGEFEKKIKFLGLIFFKTNIKSKKNIFYVKIFNMGDVNGMPNGKLGYSIEILLNGINYRIFKFYDRSMLLTIIRFLKENNYVVRGWDWDY